MPFVLGRSRATAHLTRSWVCTRMTPSTTSVSYKWPADVALRIAQRSRYSPVWMSYEPEQFIFAAGCDTTVTPRRLRTPLRRPARTVWAVRQGHCVEPPVRIELTTARLQGECSTAELRRPVLTGDSLTAQSSCSELSWSMIRCDRTVRVGERRDGRRPGSGIRSALLLNGLTTMVSDMTASCSVAMAGSSA